VIVNLGGDVAWSSLDRYTQRGLEARAVRIRPLPVKQPGAQPAGEQVKSGQHQNDGGPGRKVDPVGQDQAAIAAQNRYVLCKLCVAF
jgi:hypothetical protein